MYPGCTRDNASLRVLSRVVVMSDHPPKVVRLRIHREIVRSPLIHHPPCLRGFFLASASGAVDGRGDSLTLGFPDEDDDEAI